MKITMEKKDENLVITVSEALQDKKGDTHFEEWLKKEIEKKFGKNVVIDKRISESAKQI